MPTSFYVSYTCQLTEHAQLIKSTIFLEFSPPLNSSHTVHVHNYLSGHGSLCNGSIIQIVPQRAAILVEITLLVLAIVYLDHIQISILKLLEVLCIHKHRK